MDDMHERKGKKITPQYVNTPHVDTPAWKLEALLEPLASIPLKQVQ